MKLNPNKLISIILFLALLMTRCKQERSLPMGVEFKDSDFVFVSLDWAPDSERLVVASAEALYSGINIGQQESSEVFVWDPVSDSYLQVSDQEFTYTNSDPVWRPGTEQILYHSRTEFGNKEQVGIVDIETGEKIPLTRFGPPMDWFPDGSKIVLGEFNSLLVIDVASRNILDPDLWAAPNRNEQIFSLAVSPDGQQIAVLTRDYPSPTQLWLISEDGKEERLILENQFMDKINWSPDGNWLIFVGDKGIFATQPQNECTTDVLIIQGFVQDIDWSPNGQQIAVAAYDEKKAGVYFFDTSSKFIQEWLTSGSCPSN